MPRRAPLALLLTLALGSTPSAQGEPPPHTKTFRLRSLDLKGGEIAMCGPHALDTWHEAPGTKLWVTAYRAKVIDDKTGKEPDGHYYCHVSLMTQGRKSWRKNRFFGVHNGSPAMSLPPGFGYVLSFSADNAPAFEGMVADYDQAGKPKRLHYEVAVDYYKDKEAKKLGLRALNLQYTNLSQRQNAPSERAHGDDRNHFHWMIPPGRHEIRGPVSRDYKSFFSVDREVYHLRLHLHPRAQWGELYDKTAGKTVWRGYAHSDPKTFALIGLDQFSSTEPIRVHHDHEYELVSSYNNNTDHPIEGMMTVAFFYTTHGRANLRDEAGSESECTQDCADMPADNPFLRQMVTDGSAAPPKHRHKP